MRKTLLTTTALAMGAGGIAAAQEAEPELGIALSGAAEMGIAGSKNHSTRFHTDIQVTFTMTGATDGGLTFGAAIDLSEVGTQAGAKNTVGHGVDSATGNDDDDGGIAINVAGPFGTLTMGDTDGAFDWAMTETAVGGTLRDNHTGHPGYNGNGGLDGSHDGQILSFTHSIAGFGFGVSAELADEGGTSPRGGKTIFGVGAKYSMAMAGGASVGVGFGYQAGEQTDTNISGHVLSAHGQDYLAKNPTETTIPATTDGDNAYSDELGGFERNKRWIQTDDMSVIGASVNFDTGTGLSAIANWSKRDHEAMAPRKATDDAAYTSDASTTHFGVGFGYTTGPVTLGLNWGTSKTERTFMRKPDNTSRPPSVGRSEDKSTGFGLAANYDLGGGATLQLGVGNGKTDMTRPDNSINVSTVPNTVKVDNDTLPDTKSVDVNTWSLGLAFAF